MPTPSRTVRVFLSSTFRDFTEERDLLVRKVFPELRRKCRERQVELVDVDLRWGITEEEAKQGKVLPICLAEIDRARPYFIGFLGERYGWVPEAGQYDLSLLMEQPWLEEHRGGTSVTELEILHGVLNNPQMAGRALFYFRDSAWSYRQGDAYASESPEEKARVSTLKDRIRKSGFPVVEDYPDPEALAERVREDLWQWIDETFPEDSVPDSLTRERLMHEAYSAPRQRLYLGGEEYFKSLDEAMSAQNFLPVLVIGQSGGGKSALLANWVPRWSNLHPKTSVILHHLGAGADAADPVRIVVRLIQEIACLTGDEFKPESVPEKQLEELPQWLALGSAWAEREGRELLLVLDGLDKVSDRKDLRWFPSFLPAKVKLVVSCLEGTILQAAKGRLEWREIEVKPFTPADQLRFIGEYLLRFRKSLTPKQVQTLQSYPLSGNPLFLLTVLEELRVFGVHEQVDQRMHTLLSPPPSKREGEIPTVDDVFEHVLARIENDLGKAVVQSAVEAIWASRGGLLREELLGVAQLTPAAWAAIHNALDEGFYESAGRISFCHDYLRKAVQDRYNLTGKSKLKLHRRLAEYFVALPVDARVAEELPWQWEQANDRQKLKACLTNPKLFVLLNERDDYELLGYWLRLGEDINAAYETAWKEWELDGEKTPRENLLHLGNFLISAGYNSTFALGLLEEVFRLMHGELGPEHPVTLIAMHQLANAYSEVGRLAEARELRGEVLRVRHATLGLEHVGTLRAMQNFANSYEPNGRTDKTVEFKEAVFRKMREKLGPEHLDVLCSMQSMASSYDDAGRFEEALLLREEGLRLSREKLGPEHLDTFSAMNSLANSYAANDRLEEALELYEKVLQMRRMRLGPDHPKTLGVMGNIANSYARAGRSKEALGMQEDVLRLMREKLGSEHPDTLQAMQSLADSYSDAGRLEEALVIHEEVLRLMRKLLGPEHPDIMTAMNDLAITYIHASRLEEALVLFEEVLQLMRQHLGADHPDTLSAMYNLATAYRDAGRLEQALGMQEDVLRLMRKLLGPEHPDIMTAMNDLAITYIHASRLEEALALFEEVLQLMRQHLGADHPDTLSAMYNLANAYRDAGRLEQALGMQEDVLRLMREKLGSEHPDTLQTMGNLGVIYREAGRPEEGLVMQEEVLRLRREKLGPEHLDSFSAMNSLANSYAANGRLEDALELYEKVLQMRRMRLGPDHPKTLSVMGNLADCLNALDRRSESITLLRKASAESSVVYDGVRYYLACYECLEGNHEEAKRLISEHLKLHPEMKEQALADKDFAAIREWIVAM
jgi:nephrocystin-3